MQQAPYFLFDLGGVIINIDFTRTMQAFLPLFLPEYRFQLRGWDALAQLPSFQEYERGKIDTLTFYESLRQYMLPHVSTEDIARAWMALLLDIPSERVRLLQSLKETGHRLLLLSNTNPAHIEHIEQTLQKVHHTSFDKLFDQVFFSYHIGYTKPDMQAFSYVLASNRIEANEVVFVDDSAANIEVAKQLGMRTYHVPQNQLEIAKFFAYEI